jgi:flagellar hook-associated protein 3 FlgL
MRVNPNPLPDLLAALNQTELETQQAELQLSSGRSVNQPSDNPTAAAQLIQNNDQAIFNAGYLKSLGVVAGRLSTADATLSSADTVLQQAISLGVEAANGTLSSNNRTTIADQLQAIQNQLVSLANTSYEGTYLFAGTVTNTTPFVLDNSAPSGISYTGNSDVNHVSAGSGYTLAINVPGSQLFSSPGNDVFLAMNNIIQAVQSDTGIPAAVVSLTSATNYLSAQQSFYGNASDQAQSQTNYLTTAKLQIAVQANAIGGADVATEASNLALTQADLQATLDTIGKVTQQNTLFTYIT